MENGKYSGKNTGKLAATMERYGLGRTSIEKIARESNSKIKIGRTALYLWDRIDEYLEDLANRKCD